MDYKEEIKDLIDRAEHYVDKNKQQNNSEFKGFSDFGNLSDIFNNIINSETAKIDPLKDIFVSLTITEKEAKNGCVKEIKYKVLDEHNKKVKKSTKIFIPSIISDGQQIILRCEGNYVEGNYSNLVVKMKIKKF